jgi:hypothetical protein
VRDFNFLHVLKRHRFVFFKLNVTVLNYSTGAVLFKYIPFFNDILTLYLIKF